MTYAGRCACGAVTARIEGEPTAVRQCWCRQCQQIAAGGPTTGAVFRSADMEIAGALASHSFTAASGNTLTQHFCPECATPVYGQSSARMHLRSVRLGFLADGHGLRPKSIIWTEDAPDWAVLDPELAQYPQQPPPPAGASEGN